MKERAIIVVLLVLLLAQTIYYQRKLESKQWIIDYQRSTIKIIKNAYDELRDEWEIQRRSCY